LWVYCSEKCSFYGWTDGGFEGFERGMCKGLMNKIETVEIFKDK
jgi:hypothetical protein